MLQCLVEEIMLPHILSFVKDVDYKLFAGENMNICIFIIEENCESRKKLICILFVIFR